jgi:hypothetical protein
VRAAGSGGLTCLYCLHKSFAAFALALRCAVLVGMHVIGLSTRVQTATWCIAASSRSCRATLCGNKWSFAATS